MSEHNETSPISSSEILKLASFTFNELMEGETANNTRKVIEDGCEHFWSKRGGDPHARMFNGRKIPQKRGKSKKTK